MGLLGDYWRGGLPRDLNISKSQRRHVRRRTARKLLSTPGTLLRYLGTTLLPPLVWLALIGLVVALGIEGGYLLDPADPRVGLLITLLAGGKLGAIPLLFVGSIVAHRHYYRPLVLEVLREMDYEVCTSCGYLLRGLEEDVSNCPECGAARAVEPVMRS